MSNILIINGSYRPNGAGEQIAKCAKDSLIELGHSVEIIDLKEQNIEYCLNCRSCTQSEGKNLGTCVIEDGMRTIIEKIESAKGFVFISPTNFYSVTALYKKFMERLVVYGYWPWGQYAPKYRKDILDKKAVVISSCAAPGFMGKYLYGTNRLLKVTARTVGAKVLKSSMIGLVSQNSDVDIGQKNRDKIANMMKRF